MKIQDFAYRVAIRTIELLEQTHHYKVTDNARKEVAAQIQKELGSLMKSE